MPETNSAPRICVRGDDRALGFAAQELRRYLMQMTGQELPVVQAAEECQAGGALCLGTWEALRGTCWLQGVDLPVLDNPAFDDAITIRVQHGAGILSGANPRSVLLAVYRFLTEAGCRWVRPGALGECIPQRALAGLSVEVNEKAAYRHRGICIEGAVSCENVAEIIDWAPKVGFNGYFFQFRESYTFFERWYNHRENPAKQPEGLTVEQAREYVSQLGQEITKRGLVYHAVGHGWTCEPLGLPGLSWDSQSYDVTPQVQSYLAEVNGKREVWGGVPLNTNLCFSQPEVRRLVVEGIAEYSEQHPEVDILHFWLADGSNNQCECAACRTKRPSDWYVMMLNELDELLTQRGLSTRIVFLIYVDLLWPPEIERIQNPERFVLMFAPITRSYSAPFAVKGTSVQLPEYERNRLRFPANVDENVAFLRAWQGMFQGDSFDFDYHMMWDHYNDPGYYQTAEMIHRDIQHLKDIGLNGFVSCQEQRVFLPTGLNMVVMGRTLWDDTLEFDEIAEDYFASAFGKDGEACRSYLATLSMLFDPPYLRKEKEQLSEESAQRFAKIPAVVEGFVPTIERNLTQTKGCQAQSWRYLKYHGEYAARFARALEARARGDKEATAALWQETKQYLQQNEDAIQPVFDLFEFISTLEHRLLKG